MIFDSINSNYGLDIPTKPNINNKPDNGCISIDKNLYDNTHANSMNITEVYYDTYQIQVDKTLLTSFKLPKQSKCMMKQRSPINAICEIPDSQKINTYGSFTYLYHQFFDHNLESNYSDENMNSSDTSFIQEFEIGKTLMSKKCNRYTRKLTPSIEYLLEVKVAEKNGTFELLEVKSQNVPYRHKFIKNHFNNTLTLNDLCMRDVIIDISVDIDSFISLNTLQRHKKRTEANKEFCQLCLTIYHLNDYIAKLKKCCHIFHKKCIDELIIKHGYENVKCPVCKTKLWTD